MALAAASPSCPLPERRPKGGPRGGGLLLAAIEAEVIPRLLRAGRVAPVAARPPAAPLWGPGPDEVAALARLALETEGAAQGYLDALTARGAPAGRLQLDLLAPAARRLGVLWEEDLVAFADVTVAVGRLQRASRALDPACGPARRGGLAPRRVLLAPAPGERHTFGLSVVAAFFWRAGWEVRRETTAEGVAALLAAERFDALGLSAFGDGALEPAAEAIRAARRSSRNPGLAVLVGGPAFERGHARAALVGADATAPDAPAAVALAESLANAAGAP